MYSVFSLVKCCVSKHPEGRLTLLRLLFNTIATAYIKDDANILQKCGLV